MRQSTFNKKIMKQNIHVPSLRVYLYDFLICRSKFPGHAVRSERERITYPLFREFAERPSLAGLPKRHLVTGSESTIEVGGIGHLRSSAAARQKKVLSPR